MSRQTLKLAAVSLVIVAVCAALPVAWSRATADPTTRRFHITARQYAFEPSRIVVNKGDEIRIRLSSLDVVHGFYLEGHDLDARIEPGLAQFQVRHPSQGGDFELVDEVVITADRPGKYRYRCSHTCGTLHPFMLGEMVVRPNYVYAAGAGGAVGVLISTFLAFLLFAGPSGSGVPGEALHQQGGRR